MLQYIIGNGNQRIFFVEQAAIFANDGQTVDIGIGDKTDIHLAIPDDVTGFGQVLGQWFGIMGEVSGWFAVDLNHLLNSQCFQQIRERDTSH